MMSSNDMHITVWANTYGNYNEGRLGAGPYELPMDPAELRRRLVADLGMREGNDEVFLADWEAPDFVHPRETTSVRALNILAATIATWPTADYGAVTAWCEECGVDDPIGMANVIIQACEILFAPWDEGTFEDWERPMEADLCRAWGNKLLSEAMEAGDPALAFTYASYAFDYEGYGRDLGFYTDENGFLDTEAEWPSLDGVSVGELANAALAHDGEALWEGRLPYSRKGFFCNDMDFANAVERRVRQLYAAASDEELEAVGCWIENERTPSLVELGNLLSVAGELPYFRYDAGERPNTRRPNTRTRDGQNEALGLTLAPEAFSALSAAGDRNLARELLGYVDAEKLGCEMSYDLVLTPAGVLDLTLEGPVADAFSADELEAMATGMMRTTWFKNLKADTVACRETEILDLGFGEPDEATKGGQAL